MIVWSIWSLACGLSDQKTWATKPVTVSVPLWGQTPYETFGTFMRLHPIGWKLHIDSADGGIPVSCILTSASMHDSQAAIPLAEMTAARVDSLYDRRRHHGYVPIIAQSPRGAQAGVAQRGGCPARHRIYVSRGPTLPGTSTAERVNARLKDEFGGRHLRVRARPRSPMTLWSACMCDGCVSSKSAIRTHSESLGHVPIIASNPRRSVERRQEFRILTAGPAVAGGGRGGKLWAAQASPITGVADHWPGTAGTQRGDGAERARPSSPSRWRAQAGDGEATGTAERF